MGTATYTSGTPVIAAVNASTGEININVWRKCI